MKSTATATKRLTRQQKDLTGQPLAVVEISSRDKPVNIGLEHQLSTEPTPERNVSQASDNQPVFSPSRAGTPSEDSLDWDPSQGVFDFSNQEANSSDLGWPDWDGHLYSKDGEIDYVPPADLGIIRVSPISLLGHQANNWTPHTTQSIEASSSEDEFSSPQAGNSRVSEDTVIMAEEEKRKHELAIENAELLIEDDLTHMLANFNDYDDDYIQSIRGDATSTKRELQSAQVYLRSLDPDNYKDNFEPRITAAKDTVMDYIRKSQTVIKERRERKSSRESPEDAVAAATFKIKQDRVADHIEDTIASLLSGKERFEKLISSDPTTDMAYRALEESLHAAVKFADIVHKEGQSLYQDAVETGGVDEAKRLEIGLRNLRAARSREEERVQSFKSNLGIVGRAGDNKVLDLKPPTFSGDEGGKTDYYTFYDEFQEYLRTSVMTKSDQLKVLQKICLIGSAGIACETFESIDEVWKYLKETYGCVKILFKAKIDEIHSLGKCVGPLSKQREWAVAVKAKLDHLTKLAKRHKIENALHYSSVMFDIQNCLPIKAQEKFRTQLKEKQEESGDCGSDLEQELILPTLASFLAKFVDSLTFDIALELTANRSTMSEAPKQSTKTNPPQQKRTANHTARQTKQKKSPAKANQSTTVQASQAQPSNVGSGNASGSKPKLMDCNSCNGKHTHISYCKTFQEKSVKDRYDFLREEKVCFRCLRMDSEVDLSDRNSWWDKHQQDCCGEWACKQGSCEKRIDLKQVHMLMCVYHTKLNANRENDFIKSLDGKYIDPKVKFFFFDTHQNFNICDSAEVPSPPGREVEDDIADPSIFMVEHIQAEDGSEIVVFYDSGCAGSAISSRACKILSAKTVREGPTYLDVAGGKTLEIPTGDVKFFLDLADSDSMAAITGLEMPAITNEFPCWDTTEAWKDLNNDYLQNGSDNVPLPQMRRFIGAAKVDIIIGIKYRKYFPTILHELPSGLAALESKFKSPNGKNIILGGPHKAWRRATQLIGLNTPRILFTQETKAWQYHKSDLVDISGAICDRANFFYSKNSILSCELPEIPELKVSISSAPEDLQDICEFEHCEAHFSRSGWKIPSTWDPSPSKYSIRTDEKWFYDVEGIGGDIEYRCIRCRNCNDCRKGEMLERASLKEETEQALIQDMITFHPEKAALISFLPFIVEPTSVLTPSKHIATKVLDSQLRIVEKNPQMREDLLRSHDKLRTKGFVMAYEDLPEVERTVMDQTPEPGYFIPWRHVYKEGSISTPCRIVYDGSQSTPNGASLNSILAKGKNTLANILHILLRFRRKAIGISTDISMAYNGVLLEPAHFKYQRYLWKEELNPLNPTKVMVVRTFIYGIKCSGNTTTAGFTKLSEYCNENFPEHSAGADVLVNSIYMDDVLDSCDSVEESKKVADSLIFTLNLGSLKAKSFTFTGEKPAEDVSIDGSHIGVLGMLWDSQSDTIKLDIKELYLEKSKRGKLPDPITGDFGEALKKKFTRRIVTGKVANIFDPAGLTVPITAKYKLDLHTLCKLGLDWDDRIPEEYLECWVKNLQDIQGLREIKFKRTIIPADAESIQVELVTSVDASSKIAIAVVHTRVKRKNGSYHVQLLCAKSKLVSSLTVPRGELRAAVMGCTLTHTVKYNLGDQVVRNFFVTDNTIVLYWIHSDQRPLHVSIRNPVIQIRRFSTPDQWYHIDTEQNLADLGTRTAELQDIDVDSEWQCGKQWMALDFEDMPLRTLAEVTITNEEMRIASREIKTPEVSGLHLAKLSEAVSRIYSYSQYVFDPCRLPWNKSVRVLTLILKFCWKKAPKVMSAHTEFENVFHQQNLQSDSQPILQISSEQLKQGEKYYFLKATDEVKKFTPEKLWKGKTIEKNGILHYDGRIMEGQELVTKLEKFYDVEVLQFVRPVVDRHSPIAYSIMKYCHEKVLNHLTVPQTLRESRNIAFILKGRDLAKEVRERCVTCRRYRAKLVEVEMGKIHPNRLMIAPAFFNVQVDLFGPLTAICEHNHRSTVKVWGAVFKDPATGAIAVHCMASYNTVSFITAYTRFSARYGHPGVLYIDEGSQLIKACKTMEFSLADITTTLNGQFQVGVKFQTGPVGGHNFQGACERSIRQIKQLFQLIYGGLRLDILTYETCFAYIANELNNMPICVGSRTESLDGADIISPSRLILGRNNRRAMVGPVQMTGPSRILDQIEQVTQAWWDIWKDTHLTEYIPQPKGWKNTECVKVGDIVLFLVTDSEHLLGQPRWKIARVAEVEVSRDGLVRVVILEYRNANELVFRRTRRAVRKVAVLHHEGELELTQELNAASKHANVMYLRMNIESIKLKL